MIEPDTYYYKNMTMVMKCIQVTIDLTLILPINKSGNIKWYVDVAFAVHKYMRSHTGGFGAMVTGRVYFQSSKQKLNTKSSNEAELVRVYGVLTQVIYTRYFLKE